jgi:cytochrome c-type biogenesis protein CcmH
MTLVLVFLVLTLAITTVLVRPLLCRRPAGTGHEKREIAVYREQLAEVDQDIERGLLTKAQAETVRTEIHRRMLATEDAALAEKHEDRKPVSHRSRKVLAGFVIVLLPVAAVILYLLLGAPELPGRPFASRVNEPDIVLATGVKKMQAQLDKAPSADGYKHLAGALYMLKRYAASTDAYQKAIDLGDNEALTWSEMGENIVLGNDGAVVPEALDDFYQALKRDSKDARALFYVGLSEAQRNNPRKAVSIWKELQQDSSPDAPWFAMVKEYIEDYARKGKFDPASIRASQPSEQALHTKVKGKQNG